MSTVSGVNAIERDPRFPAARMMLQSGAYDEAIECFQELLMAFTGQFGEMAVEAVRPHFEYANALLKKAEMNSSDFLGGASAVTTGPNGNSSSNSSSSSSSGGGGGGGGSESGDAANALENPLLRMQQLAAEAKEAEENVEIAFECMDVARVILQKGGCPPAEGGEEEEEGSATTSAPSPTELRAQQIVLGQVYERLGDVAQFNNQYPQMLQEYEQSLLVRTGLGLPLHHPYFLVGMGHVYCMKESKKEAKEAVEKGDSEKAESKWHESKRHAREARRHYCAAMKSMRAMIHKRKVELGWEDGGAQEKTEKRQDKEKETEEGKGKGKEKREEEGERKGKDKGKGAKERESGEDADVWDDGSSLFHDDPATQFPSDKKLVDLRETLCDLQERVKMIEMASQVQSLAQARACADVANAGTWLIPLLRVQVS